jgi:tetratricopeptide (TPR) repeat protein
MGGMGKSEICRHLFRRAEKEGLPGIEAVGWLNFNRSIINTFDGQIEEWPKLGDSENPEEYFKRVNTLIKEKYGEKLLLFIDNADELSDDDKDDINHILILNCKIIITSRKPIIDRIEPKVIDPLDDEDCVALYRDHSKDTTTDDRILSDIIDLAGKHTLTIELLAKTQRETPSLSAEKLLEKLRSKSFNLSGFNYIITYISDRKSGVDGADNDNNITEGVLIEHLSKVFNITGIDKDGEQERILRLISLMPYPCVVSENDANEWFELKNFNKLNELANKGWLQKTHENEGGYWIHPVIASTMRHKLEPKCENSATLIESLIESLENDEGYKRKLSILPHAESVAKLLCKKDDDSDSIYEEYVDTGYYDLIYGIYDTCMFLGHYGNAMSYAIKAKEISEKINGAEHPDTAATYHNIARVYDKQGEYAKALEWCSKDLAISEKVLGAEHPDTAATDNIIAKVYNNQGDYAKALELYSKALAIKEKVLGAEHPSTATTYNNIAFVYDHQGNYATALEWFSKSYRVRISKLGDSHPDTINTKSILEITYQNAGLTEPFEKWLQRNFVA